MARNRTNHRFARAKTLPLSAHPASINRPTQATAKGPGRLLAVCMMLMGLWSAATAQGEPPARKGLHKLFGSADPPEQVYCPGCNVILISLTNVRADHLGTYGYYRNTSPNLDKFARAATVFENAYTVASWTLPVAISVYTSTSPFTHRVVSRYLPDAQGSPRTLSPEVLTLVESLRAQGFTTATVNGSRDYHPRHGLTDRFDFYVSLEADPDARWGEYGSIVDVVERAMEWLDNHRELPFFLHLQAYDTHCPFAFPRRNGRFDSDYTGAVDFTECYWTFERTLPFTRVVDGKPTRFFILKRRLRPHDVRLSERDIHHMKALYDGEIFLSDELLGVFFNYLEETGLDKRTIVVLFSEHGDIFGKHGRFMRGGPLRGTFYEDVLHVPLIVYHPGLRPKRVRTPVSLLDLAPTILDILEMPLPPSFKGKSLTPLLAEGTASAGPVYAGSYYTPQHRRSMFPHPTIITAVRDEQWKLIRETTFIDDKTHTTYELFDLENDPEEFVNQAANQFLRLEALNADINSWLAREIDVQRLVESISNKEMPNEN